MKHVKAISLPQEHLRRKHLSSHYLTTGQHVNALAGQPSTPHAKATAAQWSGLWLASHRPVQNRDMFAVPGAHVSP